MPLCTKRPKGQNLPGTKRPKGQTVPGTKRPRDKTSQGTKRPKAYLGIVTFKSNFR